MNTQIENLLITAGLGALQTFFIVVGLGAIQFLVSILIKTRIEESIRGDYARFLEKFKYDLRVREQAAKVAELFAETQLHWGDSKLTPEKARKINRLAWELSLWLPVDSARELMRNLRWAKEADARDSGRHQKAPSHESEGRIKAGGDSLFRGGER